MSMPSKMIFLATTGACLLAAASAMTEAEQSAKITALSAQLATLQELEANNTIAWLAKVEETKTWGPNVITTHLVTGRNQFFVVGGYIPPSDLTTLAQIQKAWDQCPKGCIPLFLGDLNINLESPRDERDEQIAEECDFWELEDTSRNFRQRRRRRAQGRWTW